MIQLSEKPFTTPFDLEYKIFDKNNQIGSIEFLYDYSIFNYSSILFK